MVLGKSQSYEQPQQLRVLEPKENKSNQKGTNRLAYSGPVNSSMP